MPFKVLFKPTGQQIVVGEGETILQAALAQGVNWPYGCAHGMCGACKARVLSGSVEVGETSVFALFEDEQEEGLILACCSRPTSDLVLTLPQDDSLPE